uniref:Phosphatase and actin regulator 1 n=1 Tax=Glossina austeni TaxID=7395 RepID=A0A1A9UZA2_GLOAU
MSTICGELPLRDESIMEDNLLLNGTSKLEAEKQNKNSLSSGLRTPPLEWLKDKLNGLDCCLRPWKRRRKRKSEKLEGASKSLEYKISISTNSRELVQNNMLLPERPLDNIQEPDGGSYHNYSKANIPSISNSIPLKSVLKIKLRHASSASSLPAISVQDHNNANAGSVSQTMGSTNTSNSTDGSTSSTQRPLAIRQDTVCSHRLIRQPMFKTNSSGTIEHKGFTRSFVVPESGNDRDEDDGFMIHCDNNNTGQAKIARKEFLSLKLQLGSDKRDLIHRNILYRVTDNVLKNIRKAIGARLLRRLIIAPAEEEKQKEKKKTCLLRKLSFRPTIEKLRKGKTIRFNDYIKVTQAHDYDRRVDKPWKKLTLEEKGAICKELNRFKSYEMAVHEGSRHLTKFHRR